MTEMKEKRKTMVAFTHMGFSAAWLGRNYRGIAFALT